MSHAGWFSCNSSAVEHMGLTLFQMSWSNTDVNSQADNVNSKYEPLKAMGNSQLGNTVCPEQLKVKTSEGGGYMDVGQNCSLAYVLHTSGTTGTPKIVRVPHKCIVPNIQHLKYVWFSVFPLKTFTKLLFRDSLSTSEGCVLGLC